MTLLSPPADAPGTVCPQARQPAARAAGRRSRVEQLARAARAGRLLVDTRMPPGYHGVVIDPRDVAAAIVLHLGRGRS